MHYMQMAPSACIGAGSRLHGWSSVFPLHPLQSMQVHAFYPVRLNLVVQGSVSGIRFTLK